MGVRTARVNRTSPAPRLAELKLERNMVFHGVGWIRRESLDEGVRKGNILLGQSDRLFFTTSHVASPRTGSYTACEQMQLTTPNPS